MNIKNIILQTAADEEAPTGNNRFEGFCVDLLEQIANQVGFNYQIELVQDNNYGALNLTTGEWNFWIYQIFSQILIGYEQSFVNSCKENYS